MSINYCTLANSSVDSFCGNRRSIVLNRLIHELRPAPVVRGGNPLHVRERIPQIIHRRRDREEEDQVVVPTELDKVMVTVTFEGQTGSETQQADHRLDIVYITELKVENTPLSVNISAIKFNE